MWHHVVKHNGVDNQVVSPVIETWGGKSNTVNGEILYMFLKTEKGYLGHLPKKDQESHKNTSESCATIAEHKSHGYSLAGGQIQQVSWKTMFNT